MILFLNDKVTSHGKTVGMVAARSYRDYHCIETSLERFESFAEDRNLKPRGHAVIATMSNLLRPSLTWAVSEVRLVLSGKKVSQKVPASYVSEQTFSAILVRSWPECEGHFHFHFHFLRTFVTLQSGHEGESRGPDFSFGDGINCISS